MDIFHIDCRPRRQNQSPKGHCVLWLGLLPQPAGHLSPNMLRDVAIRRLGHMDIIQWYRTTATDVVRLVAASRAVLGGVCHSNRDPIRPNVLARPWRGSRPVPDAELVVQVSHTSLRGVLGISILLEDLTLLVGIQKRLDLLGDDHLGVDGLREVLVKKTELCFPIPGHSSPNAHLGGMPVDRMTQ